MTHQALYRVYRSASFSDLIGQEVIKKTLLNAVKNDRISHAYIFNGPRGTGKTSVAKIFAKAINCLEPVNGDCCNKCVNCIGINNNTITDILEIDAASNTGVDQIRYIIDNTNFLPVTTKYKVYIIDEVHSLSSNAFNALLKTLEEPPANIVFILATTEGHKLMPTILSRCQRFDFKSISQKDIEDRISYICNKENIKIENDAIKLIALNSTGGLRDAISLLDQANSFKLNDEIITTDMIHLISGSVNDETLNNIMHAIINSNSNDALLLLNNLFENGKNLSNIISDLLNYFKNFLLYLNDKKTNVSLYSCFNNNVVKDDIHFYINIILKLQDDIRYTTLKQVLIEIAIIKMSNYKLGSYTISQSESNNRFDTSLLDKLSLRINSIQDEVNLIKNSKNTNYDENDFSYYHNSNAKKEQLINIIDVLNALKNKDDEKTATFQKAWLALSNFKDVSLQAAASMISRCSLKVVSSEKTFLLTSTNSYLIEQIFNTYYEKIFSIFNRKNNVVDKILIILEKDYEVILNSLNNNEVLESYDFGVYKKSNSKQLDEISKKALDFFGVEKLEIK